MPKEVVPAPAPTKEATPNIEKPVVSDSNFLDQWEEILKNITMSSVRMSLKTCHIESVTDNKVVIDVLTKFHFDSLNHAAVIANIEEAIKKVLGKDLQVKLELSKVEIGLKRTEEEKSVVGEAKRIFAE